MTALIVPGLNGSGPEHWQSRWEADRTDCRRVDLGCWTAPVRSVWLARLEDAVASSPTPVVIVAHSLGCHATVWWAAQHARRHGDRVLGAMLVAPPDLRRDALHPKLRPFSPEPETRLPFPSLLVASRNDAYASFRSQEEMAARWGCDLVDAGMLGHINAESGLGAWAEGQALLESLIAAASPRMPAPPAYQPPTPSDAIGRPPA